VRAWLFSWIILWAGVLLVSCVTISETGEKKLILISAQEEAKLGASSFSGLKKTEKISADPVANEQVNRVVARLLPHTNTPVEQWEVTVFDNPSPNAFALPGGKIGVHTGILKVAETDAGLATVIGHEIAHITLRHGAQRMTQQLGLTLGYSMLGLAMSQDDYRTRQVALAVYGAGTQIGLVLPHSRGDELEADRIGLRYMAKAGYDPREASKFWQRMSQAGGDKPAEFLSTHPADQTRISQIEALIPEVIPYYEAAKTSPPP
jgi:metalloendopeptidase OMA1, mitochondrial